MSNQEKYLRVNQVVERVPIGISTVWAWAKSGQFPAPIRLGARTTAWRESDIDRFLTLRAAGEPWTAAQGVQNG